jgi:hypothetical protein
MIAALALGPAAPAAAAALPPNNGGVDQYVAPVPDSGGDRPANPGGGGHGGQTQSQLPAQVRSTLPAGSEGVLLSRLATDPGSGAPAGTGGGGSADASGGSAGLDGSRDGGGAGDSKLTGEKKDVTAASAISSSISDDPAVAVVVLAIVGLTLALAAIGFARRRRGA